jgi:ABC-type glutathione transport system ATPase component
LPTKPDTQETGTYLVEVRDLSVHFELRGGTLSRLLGRDTGTIKAVDGVNLALKPGEVVGLVGESGSGKSTLGRALLGLVPATHGSIYLQDKNLADLSRRQLREIRQVVQMVFQDPNAALNPSMTVEEAVADALRVHGIRSAADRRCRRSSSS